MFLCGHPSKHWFAWVAIESVPIPRRLEYQTGRTTKALSVLPEVCDCWLGCIWPFTQLWQFGGIPWWAQRKGLVWVSVFLIGYLLNDLHWGLLMQILSIKLTGMQYSTPALSLLLEEHLPGMSPFPWGDSIHVLKGSACQWHVDRPDHMWNIQIGTWIPYYTSVLAKTWLGLWA